jgi:hypothetical protein
MPQDHVFDLLAGYALGCLDDEDLLTVARHLPHCPVCRSELAAYWIATDQLALAVPLRIPPADLKAKILRRVGSGADSAAASAPVPAPTLSAPTQGEGGFLHVLRGLFLRPSGALFGAAAVLLVVFLALSNLLLWQQVQSLQGRVPSDHTRIVMLEGTNKAPGTRGYMMVFSGENYGTLVVEDAPALPGDYQYQLWLIQDGKRTSGGVFSVDRQGYGTLQISADRPLEKFSSFGVTIEPQGGSPGPTGEKVLGGDL